MGLFKIIDSDKSQLIVETDYYKWLLKNKPSDIHSINTKIDYLTEQGFRKGIDKITAIASSTLKAIEEAYFIFEIKPTKKFYNEN
jgi:GTP-binding protein EngB required for normal cell division